jgi:hypothetical protein
METPLLNIAGREYNGSGVKRKWYFRIKTGPVRARDRGLIAAPADLSVRGAEHYGLLFDSGLIL